MCVWWEKGKAAVTRPRMYCHGHNNMRADGGGGKGEEDDWETHLRLLYLQSPDRNASWPRFAKVVVSPCTRVENDRGIHTHTRKKKKKDKTKLTLGILAGRCHRSDGHR